MASRILVALAISATLLTACSKSEPPAKPKAAAPVTPAPATAGGAQQQGDIDPALRERLARQEAASQMFDRKAAAAPEAPKADPKAAKAAPPPAPEPAKPTPPPAEPPKVVAAAAPAKAPEKAPATTPAPASAPAKSETAPRTDVAAAKPSAAPAPAPAAARLLSRVDPDFPREAIQAGVDKGIVRARMMLDEKGDVSRVEVVDATPRRVFDRAVIRALSQWKFSDGPAGRTVEMDIEFKR